MVYNSKIGFGNLLQHPSQNWVTHTHTQICWDVDCGGDKLGTTVCPHWPNLSLVIKYNYVISLSAFCLGHFKNNIKIYIGK